MGLGYWEGVEAKRKDQVGAAPVSVDIPLKRRAVGKRCKTRLISAHEEPSSFISYYFVPGPGRPWVALTTLFFSWPTALRSSAFWIGVKA